MTEEIAQRPISHLTETARLVQKDVVTMIHLAGDGHPAPSLSVVDIVTALYFSIMNVDPARPDWKDRDWLILYCPKVMPAPRYIPPWPVRVTFLWMPYQILQKYSLSFWTYVQV